MKSAAFFDVDGTLVHGTVIHYYAWLLGQRAKAAQSSGFRVQGSGKDSFDRESCTVSRLRLAVHLPRYWWLDRRGRDHFLRAFYRNYAGYTPDELASLQAALFQEVTQPRLLPEGEATVRSHREAGQQVVILSASLRFVLEPLACHLGVDELICQELAVRNGALTGELEGLPLSGEERAARLCEYARRHRLDLAASYAYGDSAGDLPMLEAVGHPIAVNPTRSLRREAQRQGWPIVRWQRGQR